MTNTILDLKRWRPSHYKVGDHDVRFEVGLLKRLDARALTRGFMKHFKKVHAAPEDLPKEELGELVLEAMDGLTDELGEERLKDFFVRYVRKVEGLSIDGEAVTTGEGLFDLADDFLLQGVLMALNGAATLTDKEGEASASRSTSSPSEGTGNGDSGAPSTEREAGASSSTATPTPPSTPSSTRPRESTATSEYAPTSAPPAS